MFETEIYQSPFLLLTLVNFFNIDIRLIADTDSGLMSLSTLSLETSVAKLCITPVLQYTFGCVLFSCTKSVSVRARSAAQIEK